MTAFATESRGQGYKASVEGSLEALRANSRLGLHMNEDHIQPFTCNPDVWRCLNVPPHEVLGRIAQSEAGRLAVHIKEECDTNYRPPSGCVDKKTTNSLYAFSPDAWNCFNTPPEEVTEKIAQQRLDGKSGMPFISLSLLPPAGMEAHRQLGAFSKDLKQMAKNILDIEIGAPLAGQEAAMNKLKADLRTCKTATGYDL